METRSTPIEPSTRAGLTNTGKGGPRNERPRSSPGPRTTLPRATRTFDGAGSCTGTTRYGYDNLGYISAPTATLPSSTLATSHDGLLTTLLDEVFTTGHTCFQTADNNGLLVAAPLTNPAGALQAVAVAEFTGQAGHLAGRLADATLRELAQRQEIARENSSPLFWAAVALFGDPQAVPSPLLPWSWLAGWRQRRHRRRYGDIRGATHSQPGR